MISDSDSKVILKLFSPFCVYSYLSGEMGSLRCSWAIQIIVAMAIFLWHEKGLWIFRGLLMCFCVYIYVYESCKCVLGGSVDGEVGFSYT